jgi:hypothetical protein
MKVLDLTLWNWLAAFTGSGLVGYALKLKGAQSWGIFLLAWILVGILVYRVFGVQQPAVYLGLQGDSKYPDLKNGLISQ